MRAVDWYRSIAAGIACGKHRDEGRMTVASILPRKIGNLNVRIITQTEQQNIVVTRPPSRLSDSSAPGYRIF